MLTRDDPCASSAAGWGGREGRGAVLGGPGGRGARRGAGPPGAVLLPPAPALARPRAPPDLASARGGDAARAGRPHAPRRPRDDVPRRSFGVIERHTPRRAI